MERMGSWLHEQQVVTNSTQLSVDKGGRVVNSSHKLISHAECYVKYHLDDLQEANIGSNFCRPIIPYNPAGRNHQPAGAVKQVQMVDVDIGKIVVGKNIG